MAKWLYEQEMRQLIGLVFQVRNELGTGWSEEIYHQALIRVAKKQDIPIRSKPRTSLVHRGVEVHTFEADLIFWDKIILELKVLWEYQGKKFPAANQAQLLHYLKFYRMSVGALINFAHPQVGIQRMIFVPRPVKFDEDYERMRLHVTEDDREILLQVRQHIKNLAMQYGFGYPETIYREMVAVELNHHGIPCTGEPDVTARLHDDILGTHKIPHLLVANRFLLYIRSSLKHIPTHDYLRTQTYLSALGLKVGWVINFGRHTLQIHATSP